jgi:hypothetical protein
MQAVRLAAEFGACDLARQHRELAAAQNGAWTAAELGSGDAAVGGPGCQSRR